MMDLKSSILVKMTAREQLESVFCKVSAAKKLKIFYAGMFRAEVQTPILLYTNVAVHVGSAVDSLSFSLEVMRVFS